MRNSNGTYSLKIFMYDVLVKIISKSMENSYEIWTKKMNKANYH